MCCTDVSICESHKNLERVGLEDVKKKGGAHLDKKGSDGLGHCSEKLEMRPTGKLTFGIIWAWAWILSNMRHDEDMGTYHEAPVMQTVSE
jgi:hypothetical protein